MGVNGAHTEDHSSARSLLPIGPRTIGTHIVPALVFSVFAIHLFQSLSPGLLSTKACAMQLGNQNYQIKANVDLVLVNTTVTDQENHFVGGLNKDNFLVFEDGIKQKISMFSNNDIPVSMGLVIDNSGSMLEKRAQVNAAAITFVETSNHEDEVFVVNFSEEIYLDSGEYFVHDVQKLKEALSRIEARGGTALYDAIIASLDHLSKGYMDKKVLLVITDGDDDASHSSFAKTIRLARESDATIYAIGVFSQEDRKHYRTMVRHSKRDLTQLAKATGGTAYFPDDLSQVEAICTRVASDIRRQYTLGYYPLNPATDGKFRTLRVEVPMQQGMRKLTVTARSGYYARKTP